jgi:hypothetical protein
MLRQRCDFGFTAFLVAAQASEYNGGQFCNCQSSCGHTDVMWSCCATHPPTLDLRWRTQHRVVCQEEWGGQTVRASSWLRSAGHVAVMRLVLTTLRPTSTVLTHVSRDGAYPGPDGARVSVLASGDGSEEHASCTPMLLLLHAAQKPFRGTEGGGCRPGCD